jgi:hypothetical protein
MLGSFLSSLLVWQLAQQQLLQHLLVVLMWQSSCYSAATV